MLLHPILLLCLLYMISPITSQLMVTTPTSQFGPQGTYQTLQDVAVDAAGNIYVLDSGITPGGSEVYKFLSDGTPVTGGNFPLQASMAAPFGIGVNNAAGYILVADSQSPSGSGNGHPRLVIFNLNTGAYVDAVTITGAPLDSTARKVASTPDGAFAFVAIDKIYMIPTFGIGSVQSYDGTGGSNTYGGLQAPVAVQVDPANSNRLYVADAGTHNFVAHLDLGTNTILSVINNPDTNFGASIGDIAFDSHGNLYIVSTLGHTIFQMVGISDTIGTEYAKPGMQIGGMAINSQDQVIAGDTEQQNVYTFNQAQVNGDPQFMGFQQQSFQVHGANAEFFNLVTSPSLQLNSRFIYLASGSCTYNETECWTHPGTYVDQLGLMLPGLRVEMIAGPHSKGMHVMINNETITPSKHKYHIPVNGHNKHIDIHYISQGHLMIMTPVISMDIMNSDNFFNLGFSLHSSLTKLLHAGHKKHPIKSDSDLINFYPEFPLHGLVGQTWKNARFGGDKMYQGDITDYMLDDAMLFSTHFTYNLYQQA